MRLFGVKQATGVIGGVLLGALLLGTALLYSANSPTPAPEPPTVVNTANQALQPVALSTSAYNLPPEPTHFPIEVGQTGPVHARYAGPPQYPFYCMSQQSGLGQPLVDNQQGFGVPVYASDAQIGQPEALIGYSKDCSINTRVDYYYLDKATQQLAPLDQLSHYQDHPLYRIERGSINRFLYAIIMPVAAEDLGNNGHSSRWNQRLIYRFHGGAGIGFRQGKLRIKKSTEYLIDQLEQGTAVITSTGNSTHNTYNMLLAEDTARRVKAQFVARYGDPLYTIGFGMSGGGLVQYLLGQNAPGLIDGAIPVVAYPDMLSQTLYALDCDLLNTYYGYRSHEPALWQDFNTRQAVEGLYAANGWPHVSAVLEPLNQWLSDTPSQLPQGNSSCINGWFGLSSYLHNPQQGFLKNYFTPHIQQTRRWNYWEDLVQIFGRNKAGYAQSLWDNTGVQYGLEALKQGKISPETFIHLNWHIGSWKPPEAMSAEALTVIGKKGLIWLSLWSRHNITQSNALPAQSADSSLQALYPAGALPAKRFRSNPHAIEQAYRQGQVFTGKAPLPIIDVRWYLDRGFDMHHSAPSFAARLRLIQAQGHAKNHLIWVSHRDHNPLAEAFDAMHQWLTALKYSPTHSPWEAKPETLQDSCFDSQGYRIASGDGVWNGDWNQSTSPGLCNHVYPVHADSRIQAGAPWQGGIFQCQLTPIGKAIDQGLYGELDLSAYRDLLERTFPEGVCDYQHPQTTQHTRPNQRPLPSGSLRAELPKERQKNKPTTCVPAQPSESPCV